MRATQGAIPAADFACDDGRSQGVLGAPVGGVDDIRLEQEREDRGEFNGEMRRELLGDAAAAGAIDEGIELILQMTTRHGDPMRRHLVRARPVAHAQGVLQNPLDARREVPLVLIAYERATAAQQVRETGLMDRVRKPAIRRPAVAHQHAVEVVGGLQGMPALDAPVTALAVADGNAKLADEGPHDREIFLMRGGLAGLRERATTRRTRGRQRRVVVLVDASRWGSMRLPPIGATRLAPGTQRRPARGAARERRRLSMERAARLVEIALQPVDSCGPSGRRRSAVLRFRSSFFVLRSSVLSS